MANTTLIYTYIQDSGYKLQYVASVLHISSNTLRHKLQGYWNYFAVPGNSRMTSRYNWHAVRLLYKWLNRRSQRRSIGWREFLAKLPAWKLPAPRIRPVEPQMQLRPQANHA